MVKKQKYFDVTEIYADIEAKDKFDMGDILTKYEDYGFSHRWIQPPVACYFVNTLDAHGNVNTAPISMGTAMWGEPSDCGWYYCFDVHNRRQTRRNLDINKECVISYYPYSLMKESWITGMPIPYGISELDVAQMTPFESKQVKPPCIAECVSNLEVKIIDRYPLSNNTLYIGKVVGCHVQKDLLEKDMQIEDEPGLAGADLVYECSITGDTPRLNYGRLIMKKRHRTDDNLGDKQRWIGNFMTWMDSEEERGRITKKEHQRLLELEKMWKGNPDPMTNKAVKNELTEMLTEICWRKAE